MGRNQKQKAKQAPNNDNKSAIEAAVDGQRLCDEETMGQSKRAKQRARKAASKAEAMAGDAKVSSEGDGPASPKPQTRGCRFAVEVETEKEKSPSGEAFGASAVGGSAEPWVIPESADEPDLEADLGGRPVPPLLCDLQGLADEPALSGADLAASTPSVPLPFQARINFAVVREAMEAEDAAVPAVAVETPAPQNQYPVRQQPAKRSKFVF